MPTTTLHVAVTPAALDRVNTLVERTEAASQAEVVRNALKVYDFLVRAHTEGAVTITVAPEGKKPERFRLVIP